MTTLYNFIIKKNRNREVFTSNDTWSVPSNVDFVDLIIVGGGGGGASTYSTSLSNPKGGGGGAGVISILRDYYVGDQSSISITVGSGGTGGTGDDNGNDGGSSSFGNVISLGGTGGGSEGARFYGGSSGHIVDPMKLELDLDIVWYDSNYSGTDAGQVGFYKVVFQNKFPWDQPNVKVGGFFFEQYFAVGGRGYSGNMNSSSSYRLNGNKGATNIGSFQEGLNAGSGAGGFYGNGGNSLTTSAGSPNLCDAPVANSGAGGGAGFGNGVSGNAFGGDGADGIVIVDWK